MYSSAISNISSQVDIFHLPTAKRIYSLPNPGPFKGGMIMAISLFYHPTTANLTVISGYESGHSTVSHLLPSSSSWKTTYINKSHIQPVLSLDISPSKEFYVTSSADAILAKHPIPTSQRSAIGAGAGEDLPLKTLQTGHAGQQSLKFRNDGKIFATAGWDSRVRVYSSKAMRELAVLKWHKEGIYGVTFAEVEVEETKAEKGSTEEGEKETGAQEKGKEIVRREQNMSVKEERLWKATHAHWLAAGSKDGKISLWEIY